MLVSPVVVGMLARQRAGMPGIVFDSRQEEEVFRFSKVFCLALGLTLRSLQSVLAALLWLVKRLGSIADRPPHLLLMLSSGVVPLCPTCLHCGARGRLYRYTLPGIVTVIG